MPGHDLADRLAAGTLWSKCLIQEGPEGDLQREDTLAAVVVGGCSGQKGVGEVRAEELAKLGQRTDLWQIGHRLFEAGDRRFPKKKRLETVKERRSKTHETSVFILSLE